ncbi:carboxypeptidase-like regulatory domain-containing protein [Blastopirellula sp. J2-11]|uniref:carboxypeptidase-like regulatory domain-containing protein n=1 Tax=Blastopirellula sp. J2-11 TaxID=2943192 RepID=UPI0021CACB02|nr:carboxypeptidase-like regulatory domain-containing protein [Blastopirellula sp. J2-11]UUO06893.1 carboxypeptidase-like regulatory domain-containing protein [Blastopirellula sp. J2-11]
MYSRTTLQNFYFGIAGGVLCCMFAGCMGGNQVPIVPVTGQVMMNDEPVSQAIVSFENARTGFAAMAVIADDGKYRIRSQYGDGIPPGEYVVSVSPPSTRDELDKRIPLTPIQAKIPRKFQFSQSSNLSASVKEGKSTFNFQLGSSSTDHR